ncbi:MAG TPA: GNAT family N-acetyltransferase, partial [Candidatus Cybelea sp.]|nr:GNAT family N-acetyltransferase [Candidatus Cybelea sp.]
MTRQDAQLYNLVVDLNQPFDDPSIPGLEISETESADERTLAWIDDIFGGSWSSEAFAGSNIIARRDGAPIAFATIDPKGLRFAWLGGITQEPGAGIAGPLGVAPHERRRGIGRAVLRAALAALRSRGFFRALVPAVSEDLLPYYAATAGATVAERFDRAALYRPARRVLVMASGNGSNFQAVADAVREGTLPIDIVALLSNNLHAFALVRARDAGIPSHVIAWNRRVESREEYDQRLFEAVAAERPDLVLMLGWMHLLSKSFVDAVAEIANLHPAFLPLDPASDEVTMPDGTKIPAFR